MQNRRRVLLVFVPFVAGYFLTCVFRSINSVVAADLSSEFALDAASLGLLTSAFFLTFAAAQLPLGVLLDRHGPRRVQSYLLPIAAAGALVISAAQSVLMLTLGRAILGLGMAGALMAGLKALIESFPKERLALVNGCFVMIGALGAVTATTPAEWLLRSVGWRGLFVTLASATAACALLIRALAPGSERRDGIKQATAGGLKAIMTDPRFWQVAPLGATCIGTSWALQGLWAASWLADVEALERPQVVEHLFVMAIALSPAALLLGLGADRLRRSGVSISNTLACAATLFIAAQLALIFRWPLPPYLLWSIISGFGTATVLHYAILADHYPKEVAGRANAALNVFQLGGALVVQFGTGAILQSWTGNDGRYPAVAYQVAFAINLALQVFALIWFLWSRTSTSPATNARASRPGRLLDPAFILTMERHRRARLAWDECMTATQAQLRCWRLAAVGSMAMVALLGSGLFANHSGSAVVPHVVQADSPARQIAGSKVNLVRYSPR